MAKRKVFAEVVVDRPVSEVFAFVKDMDNHMTWQTGVLESKITSDGEVGVGSTYKYVTQMMGRQISTTGEIITCDTNTRFMYRSTSGPFQIVGGYTFEKDGDRTKVTQRIVADIEGFFRLAEPIVVRSVQRNIQNNLQTLKETLEALKPEMAD
jgi:uncharacterized membrane protein